MFEHFAALLEMLSTGNKCQHLYNQKISLQNKDADEKMVSYAIGYKYMTDFSSVQIFNIKKY